MPTPDTPASLWLGSSSMHQPDPSRIVTWAENIERASDGYVPEAFGAVADGATATPTDNTAAITATISAAAAGTKAQTVRLAAGEYGYQSTINITESNTTLRFGATARLVPLTTATAITVQGSAPSSWTALTADADEGDSTVTVTSVSGMSVGGWIEVRSDALLPGSNTEGGKCCVIARIIAISGSTVTLDRPLPYDFTTADSATAGVPTMIENIVLDGVKLNREGYTTLLSHGIYLRYCANVTILNPVIIGSKTPAAADGSGGTGGTRSGVNGISMSRVDGVRIVNPTIRHITWYGIGISGYCDNVRIEGGLIEDCRHAISVVWLTNDYGEPHNLVITGVTGRNCNLSIFDTHDTGRGIVFDKVKAFGSRTDSGFQVRNRGTVLRGCEAAYNYFDGIVGRLDHAGLRIDDPTVYNNGRNGISTINPVQITGGEVINNGLSGAGYALSLPGGRVFGTKLRANLSVTGANTVIYFLTDTTYSSDAPLVLDGVDCLRTNSGQWMIQKVLARYCQEIVITNSDYSDFGDNLVRGSMNSGEIGPRRLNNITTATIANRAGRATLSGGIATVTNAAVIRRFSDPLWASQIRVTRMVTSGANGALSIGQINTDGTFTIISSNASDASTVEWEITG